MATTLRTDAENIKIGAQAKKNIRSYKALGLEEIARRPELQDYIQDLVCFTRLEEMSDLLLGRILERATKTNLKQLGYRGARSDKGDDITPLFTVALRKTDDGFPGVKATSGWRDEDGGPIRFRGPLNRTDVRTYFYRSLDELVNTLIEQIATR